MTKYRVLAKSYINNAIREEGEVVEYEGKPGKSLALIAQAQPAAEKVEGEKKGKGKKDEGDAGAA